ncbi:polysaccharide pyruvyl transferase family protein [Massilia sp. PAMC28688]|uniref:polysaccharide pyruvyl transferase family protein n=1 Tax=Massilia sp. PAMC28688 TaxID=2861283 RepID=UPI001C62D5CB|nr:polysaccharide pyruvyl transferase family protein [Massilia sp. PAMC28688]QYF95009.1 polysaccharide pyruvyl transferase family protein [Massilia sp. PAMC28688]
MNVFLLNDTATIPHVGCQAVSDAHARLLGDAGHIVSDRAFLGELRSFAGSDEDAAIAAVLADPALRRRIEACDAMVINGEGTLHHGFGSEYFACLGAAQQLGKKTLIVNAVFEAHTGWLDILGRLDDFCIRDAESLRHAESLGLPARLVPDSFMAAVFSADAAVDLSGQIVVTDWHPFRDADVGATLRQILDNVEGSFYYPLQHGMHTHLWRGAVADWSAASIIITARHHGIYLAARAGKPFVALPSNTRKIEGLIAASGARIPVATSGDQVQAAFEYAMDNLDQYQKLFDWLAQQTPLTTFRALGNGEAEGGAAAELARLAQQVRGRHTGLAPQFWGLRNGAASTLSSS